MSNLIPEKRVDKNGVAVTRHVRVPKAPVPAKPMPVPTMQVREIGLKVPPTNSQTREHSYLFEGSKFPVDHDLARKLDLAPGRPIIAVHGSDQEIYEVLAVTDRSTAIALLEHGVRSADEAVEVLEAFDREDLIQDNSKVVNDAFDRMVLSHTFMSHNDPDDLSKPNYVDYIEALDMTPLRGNTDLHESVRDGLVRIEDIREVTPHRISLTGHWRVIKPALMKIADGTANYTAEGVVQVLSVYKPPVQAHELETAFVFAQRYGAEFATKTVPIGYYTKEFSDSIEEHEFDQDRGRSIVGYFQRVQDCRRRANNDIPVDDIILFHDAGIDPQLVAAGQITRVQAEAIKNHGVAPSVSGGWL